MDKASFSGLIANIFAFFRYDKLPDPKQMGIWYEDVKFIPVGAVDGVLKAIKDHDTIPRNLPKALKQAYNGLPKKTADRKYDAHDDPDYPVDNLWSALKILESRGDEAFIYYCRTVNMPTMDIERVRNKHNHVITKQQVLSMAAKIGG